MRMKDTPLWTWHITAGIVILVLLGMHMAVMHLDGVLHLTTSTPSGAGTPIDWANVAERAREVAFVVFYVVLLGAALFHGLYGLRNILFELRLSEGAKSFVSVVLLVVGFGLFILGTWAAIVARSTALAA
jgi:succinate dehydrogenase hydrophobic anchor subunit